MFINQGGGNIIKIINIFFFIYIISGFFTLYSIYTFFEIYLFHNLQGSKLKLKNQILNKMEDKL